MVEKCLISIFLSQTTSPHKANHNVCAHSASHLLQADQIKSFVIQIVESGTLNQPGTPSAAQQRGGRTESSLTGP